MELPDGLALAVVASAAMHAAWNALVKASDDKLRVLTAVTVAYGAVAAVALPFTPLPAAAAWPFLLASATVHQLYRLALARMYERGELGQVYPLARGTAPLLVALGMAALGEVPDRADLGAMALVLAGVLGLAGAGGTRGAVGAALAVAAPITAYTVIDGLGARRSGAPVSYALWLAAIDAAAFTAQMLWRGGLSWLRGASWAAAIGGGSLSLAAYAIALYAVTQGAVGVVAALRETSVVFAALLGRLLFREPFGGRRLVASLAVAAGLLWMQIG